MSMTGCFALGFIIGAAMVLLVAWICAVLAGEEHGPIDL